MVIISLVKYPTLLNLLFVKLIGAC